MGNTFIASEIRIEWAREKLKQLELLVERGVQDALKTPVGQTSDDRMRVLFDLLDKVTPEARRLVSEYALHARAALDYIIYDLAFHNIGSEPKGTQFPICEREKDFPKKSDGGGNGALKHLTPEQVALIERFQPYRGFPLLQVLHVLSNQDKHREFAHISATGMTNPVHAPDTNAVAAGGEMKMKFHRSFQIELGNHGEALKTLSQIQTHLSKILEAFNALLDP